MEQMENSKNRYKVVMVNGRNDDQCLFGFYDTRVEAEREVASCELKDRKRLLIKRVDPEMIARPVDTDYMHYYWSLIPKKERRRVLKSDASSEIHPNSLMCGGETYYYLSRIIPKDWCVVDIGCGYNAQSYFFREHARYIAVTPDRDQCGYHFERFVADGTELFNMTAGAFVKDVLPTLGLSVERTFAICNYVPNWYGEKVNEIVRKNLKNVFVFYPKSE